MERSIEIDKCSLKISFENAFSSLFITEHDNLQYFGYVTDIDAT